MSVFRVEKTKDFTVMSNFHFKDKRISLKAKGLLSLMLSLPDNWDYSISGLVAICQENETAIKSALNELKDFGYLEVTKLLPDQTESGRIEYIYTIYEQPKQDTEKQEIEKQGIEILPLEILPLENQGQLNTNILNTKELNTNKSNTNNKRFKPPKLEEVRSYCLERKNNIDYQYFYDYYERQGWYIGNGRKMKDWQAAVRTWERNNKKISKPATDNDHTLDGIL